MSDEKLSVAAIIVLRSNIFNSLSPLSELIADSRRNILLRRCFFFCPRWSEEFVHTEEEQLNLILTILLHFRFFYDYHISAMR